MRIVVVGAGAVGGYFGVMLANAGHQVAFVARGAQLAAIRKKGLRLTGPRGDFGTGPCEASDEPAELGRADVVLFCVKLYDTEAAGRQLAPLLKDGGVCISLQNGVDAVERLSPILGAGQVMGGLAYCSGVIAEPGLIRYVSQMSSIVYGENDGSLSPRALAFQAACESAGFKAEVSRDIRASQWGKFVALSTNAAMSCVVRQPAGIVYHTPETTEMAMRGFAEVAAVARKQGIAIAPDAEQRALAQHRGFPPDMYASMYHDLRLGKRLELEGLSGVVVRKGAELGVPTPVHAFARAVLLPYLNGTPELPKQ